MPFSPLLGWAVVAGLAAFTVLAVALIRRRQGAWRALVFLLLVYLANMGILAAGRFNVTDITALATDLQYYVDVHIATLVAFVLGFTVLPGAAPAGQPAGRRARRPRRRTARGPGGGGLDDRDCPRPRPRQPPDRRQRLRQHGPQPTCASGPALTR